jgi:hypothetical protein
MKGGAWPFLVGGVICLVNSVNERDLDLLTSPSKLRLLADFLEGQSVSLRCPGLHARYTDELNEFITLAEMSG